MDKRNKTTGRGQTRGHEPMREIGKRTATKRTRSRRSSSALPAVDRCRCGRPRNPERPDRCTAGHQWRGEPGPRLRAGLRAQTLPAGNPEGVATRALRAIDAHLDRLVRHISGHTPTLRDVRDIGVALDLVQRADALAESIHCMTPADYETAVRLAMAAVGRRVSSPAVRRQIVADIQTLAQAQTPGTPIDLSSLPPPSAPAVDIEAVRAAMDDDLRLAGQVRRMWLDALASDEGLRREAMAAIVAVEDDIPVPVRIDIDVATGALLPVSDEDDE